MEKDDEQTEDSESENVSKHILKRLGAKQAVTQANAEELVPEV